MPAPAAPAQAHPAVVAAAVLLVVLVCGTGAFGLLSEVVTRTVERTDTFTPTAGRVTIDADGDVSLEPSPDGQVHVRTVVRTGLDEPRVVHESRASGIRLSATCREFLAVRCDARHELLVPSAIDVVVDGGWGDVVASGLRGPLSVQRDTGDITVVDHIGPLDLRSRLGEITGDDLRADVLRVESQADDVRVELLNAPRSADVTSDFGEVDVAVPADTAYRIDAASDVGEERVLVPTDPASPHTLRAVSDTGDVTVRSTR
ncbi:hypothetical protein [Pseudonocardia zijingensis]|uniref:Adhesin n=1 Tax=Pseudonocardia zijingensis TaxID=153376 RepID=A0ABN1NC75_9PSEU